ncbi:MAG: polyprenol phosphomannose-dependent alpha 1,6 mannosyltransferase MptB [Actinobacteria bacterium]|nr:polyprenol phosphomannose-dependent alpha 1,6 mannosyltransferase MptB [Actinomycetota bacterium]
MTADENGPVSDGDAVPASAVAATIEPATIPPAATSPAGALAVDTGTDLRLGSRFATGVAQWVHSLGVTPAEEVSPHAPPAGAFQERAVVSRVDLITVLSAVSGLVGTLLIAASAPVWRLAPPSWRLVVPGVPHPGSSFVNASFFTAGLVLLGFGWVGLIGRAERLPGSERRKWVTVLAVGLLWTLPVLLGPPLLSNDVYSYVAQGEMASRGFDPTAVGPVVLGRGDTLRAVDPTWRTAPAPYGPAWIGLSEAVVDATGHDPAAAVWAFRAIVVLGVLLAAIGVVQIARYYGVSETVALAVGIANPLVIIYLIGGTHNDALMMGFLALGVAAALKDRRGLAIVLVALATAVKLPAAAGLLFLGWHFAGLGASLKQRVVSVLKVVGASAAIIAAISVVTGTGIGWITALTNTGKVMDTFSLMTMLGYFASDAVKFLRITENPELLVAPVRLLGVLVSGSLSALLLWRSDRVGLPRALGLSMILVVLLSPVVWPWYLPAGFALVAAAGLGRFRPSYLVVCVAATALVWPTSVDPILFLQEYQRVLSFGVILLIAACALLAQKWAVRREARRAIRRREAMARYEELVGA